MKLQRISDQGGSLDDYYTDDLSGFHPSWGEPIERVKKLLRHLEQNVDGPPQWVTFSHGIRFYLSEEDDWRPEKARVFIDLTRQGYKIRYRSAQELHFWNSFTTLEAQNEVEAGFMILNALQLAERNLPSRDEASFRTPR
jgi:hypothetical protein